MEIKKNPKVRLENYSKLFLEIGLVLSLFITYISLEHKTYDKIIADLGAPVLTETAMEEVLMLPRMKPPRAAPPPPPPKAIEIITIVEDEKQIEETFIESTETDEEEAVEVVPIDDIVEYGEGEEIIEDVPFTLIEDIPVFPGCKGNKEKLRKCFSKKVTKHINKHFDKDLVNTLGLSEGKKKISVLFVISKSGKITNIKARAPHARLQKEAIRVIEALPKMIPGKQRGKPVNVAYAVPITFHVVLH